jgi:hypothetical protein
MSVDDTDLLHWPPLNCSSTCKTSIRGCNKLLLCITVKLVHKIMRLVLTCVLRQNMTHMYLSNVVANLLCCRSHEVRCGNVPM